MQRSFPAAFVLDCGWILDFEPWGHKGQGSTVQHYTNFLAEKLAEIILSKLVSKSNLRLLGFGGVVVLFCSVLGLIMCICVRGRACSTPGAHKKALGPLQLELTNSCNQSAVGAGD